jgi:hypothetical protein
MVQAFRVPRQAWLGLALLAGALGCSGGDSSGPKIAPEVGLYTLVTVNAGGLPAVILQNSVGRVMITSATMLVRDDKSYRETRNYQSVLTSGVTSGATTIVEDGQYSVVGTQMTFSIPANGSDPALSYTGAVSNGVLTYTYAGIAYRYQK